jgi:hypothetical protein
MFDIRTILETVESVISTDYDDSETSDALDTCDLLDSLTFDESDISDDLTDFEFIETGDVTTGFVTSDALGTDANAERFCIDDSNTIREGDTKSISVVSEMHKSEESGT